MVFGEIGPPWWDDKPVLLIGGGPSLRGFDFGRFAMIDAYRVGVNQAMFDVSVNAGITIDLRFLRARIASLTCFASTNELYVALNPRHGIEIANAIHLLSEPNGDGLSVDPRRLCDGGTSGYAALNLAILKRARRVVLLGYDYAFDADGSSQYHDAYPWVTTETAWSQWAQAFNAMRDQLQRLSVTVINGSPKSTIVAFPRCSIDAALAAA